MPGSSKPVTTLRDSIIDAQTNREMFDRISRRYDLLNSLLSLNLDHGWRNRAVAALEPEPAGTYLDIGTGTGDVGLTILRSVPTAHVLGLDPAREMMAFGRGKAERAGCLARMRFLVGDALDLPFPADRFDGAISAFCIRNVENHCRYVAEAYRVLRPGSRLVVLELTRPGNPVMRLLHGFYNRTWVALVGGLLSRGAAYRYLARSIGAFPDPPAILERLREGGFRDPRAIPLNGGIVTVFVGTR